MNEDIGLARVRLSGDLDLESISEVTHAYVEVYTIGCFLLGPRHHGIVIAEPDEESETGTYSFPWRGGYSALNFFRSIYARTPLRYRPTVLEIRYASPGFIDLVGYLGAFGFVVGTVCTCANRILTVCKNIEDHIRKHKLNKIEISQRTAEARFIASAYDEITNAMQLPTEAVEQLRLVTQGDDWARLKIALAMGRRIERVAELQRAQTLALDGPEPISGVNDAQLTEDKRRKIANKLALPLDTQEPSGRKRD